ncbi:MAG: VCBS repeat-containing protein [Bacteroidota bacterium]
MREIKFLFIVFLFSLLSCQGENNSTPSSLSSDKTLQISPLFELLPPEQTGIDFINTLEEGLNTNVLMYEYFYNGGGVAAGDFNGDDRIDLYFTSNMSENKLYLNQGNFQFKDITTIAKAAGRSGPWKTGVSVADVNGDGRLDIYLCYSGAMPAEKRQNQLFINQGNNEQNVPVFEEKAAEYGLSSAGFSNQGYFFDYDRDGDLDMLLLNHNPKSLPVLNEQKSKQMMATDDPFRGVRLFEQQENTFKDVTTSAGISSSALTYGLGIGIADANKDGWADFYVSNDYTVPDYLYINQQDGTFQNQLPEAIGHTSHFSMGNDIADVNNDGWQDIFTLDMLPADNRRQKLLMAPDNYAKFDLNVRSGFHYQYMRNMLQLNNGNGTFSEIGQLAGISNTDWSWAALLADYDNDGWKDLYVTNGYFRDYTNLDFIKYMDDFTRQKGRLQREDVMELIRQMPASDVVNYIFRNKNGYQFDDMTQQWGVQQIANSNGAAYADLDNDGDLELIVNNINLPAFIYRNNATGNHLKVVLQGLGKNSHGIGAKVELFAGNRRQELEQQPARGYLSSVSPVLHFGLDEVSAIDSLVVTWQNGRQQQLRNIAINETLTLNEKNAKSPKTTVTDLATLFKEVPTSITYENTPTFIRDFDRQPLLIKELSHTAPCMAKGDFNADGLEDVVIGGSRGQAAAMYTQQTDGQFSVSNTFATLAQLDAVCEDAAITVFDADADGDLDIYIGSGGYHAFQANDAALQDRLYLNDGKGQFRKGNLPQLRSSTHTIATSDVNGDGYEDVFVGSRVVPGRYPESPNSYLLINDRAGDFIDQTARLAPDLQNVGMVTDAVWVDLNGDEQKDLVVVGEWMPITVFINQAGKLTQQTDRFFDQSYKGWWNTIAVADFNQDGRPDLMVGNYGTNTQVQVSKEQPAELYYKDFDDNGSVDPLFCYYLQGASYPALTRDELLGQLSYLRPKFTSYESYAEADLQAIFDQKALQSAEMLSINWLETTLFLSNLSSETFKVQALPIEAQYAPVQAIHVFDYDGDQHLDLLLTGNESYNKLRIGRSNANQGMLFKGDGKGIFQYVSQTESGFQINGDVKCILEIDNSLIFGVHQKPLVAYRRN